MVTGVLVAALCVVAETLLGVLLAGGTAVASLNWVYLPGILAVSFLWGLALGLTTALASAVAFDLFLAEPTLSLRPVTGQFLATLLAFLAVALPTGVVFALSRRPRAAPREETTARPSYDRLRRIADEQAALRDLATLVAHGAPPSEVFGAVARELAHVLGTSHTVIARYLPDGVSLVVAGTWNYEKIVPAGTRWNLEKGTVCELVHRTRAPGRVGGYHSDGVLTNRLRDRGVCSSVGCPIMVGRELWGVAIASSSTPEPLPADTEERMLEFTELAATAIANAQARSDLLASRARVVTATDETRRRIERDLHHGTQQNLVSIGLEIRAIKSVIPPELDQIRQQLSVTARAVDGVVTELQEISRGLHPALVARGGLKPALRVLARRSTVPVELTVPKECRLPERLEVTVYYIVAEALANAAKHAHATTVWVELDMCETIIRLLIRDDGVGGADPAQGTGLAGLTDRVSALGGLMEIISPVGGGTTLRAEIPGESAISLG
jgi:signal transduction histidine kinase